MATERSPRSANRRRRLIPIALLGWTVVIITGAGRRSDSSPLVGVENLDAVLLVALLSMALLGLLLLVVLNPFQRTWSERPRPRSWGWGYLFILALILLMANPDILDDFLDRRTETEEAESVNAEPAEQNDDVAVETVAQATDLLLLMAAAGAVAGVWLLLRRKAEIGAADDTEAFEAELLMAIEQADAELAVGDDPRTAVLNAYANLERVLASRGPNRLPAETTAEHVQRAMSALQVDSSAVVKLAALYELARFSDQPITERHRQDAQSALDVARAELTPTR